VTTFACPIGRLNGLSENDAQMSLDATWRPSIIRRSTANRTHKETATIRYLRNKYSYGRSGGTDFHDPAHHKLKLTAVSTAKRSDRAWRRRAPRTGTIVRPATQPWETAAGDFHMVEPFGSLRSPVVRDIEVAV